MEKALTLSEDALISATEINPASEADLKALTPKAQTPNCALLGASVAALASHTTGLCHTTLQPNTCVLCCSILSHRDSREKRSVRGRLAASPFFLLVSVTNSRELLMEQGYHPCRDAKRITGMTWFSLHLTTPETLFEGVSPPTAVFLLMTHKIPHESDTICLIKPAAKMKLYIWCLKKQGIDKKKPNKHKTNKINPY